MRLSLLMPGIFTLLTLPHYALANPSAAVLDSIRTSYRPEISFSRASASTVGIPGFMTCNEEEVTISGYDPVTKKPRRVEAAVFWPSQAADPGNLKTILVEPPTGGANPLDLGFATSSCLAGFRVAVVRSWDHLGDFNTSLDAHDEDALREIAAIRNVLEYLHPRRASQVGILGTSRGAIAASVVLAIEPRLAAGALIAGGGYLPEIIAVSQAEDMTKLREARQNLFHYQDNNAYLADLRTHVHFEPMDFVDLAPKKPIWFMIAEDDVTVPTVNQKALASAYGPQRAHVESLPGDHIGVIIKTFLTKTPEILEFFLNSLN